MVIMILMTGVVIVTAFIHDDMEGDIFWEGKAILAFDFNVKG